MFSYFMCVCLLQIIVYFPRNGFSLNWPNDFSFTFIGLQPSCLSRIFCESEFMHDVQLAGIYNDSKTFVDKKLKITETIILKEYKKLKESHGNRVPPKSVLTEFIDTYLKDGDELEVWTPPDYTESPSILYRIQDQNYRLWASNLNYIWKTLARKVKDDVKNHPALYSLLWVPNGFIIPGGRFRELYYWDTYWIVNGLLLCDMKDTARGIIENIISLVNEFGFMPNGGRVYYLNRSQPPMLILMVLSYYKATQDFEYIKSIISSLEVEFQFWMDNRMVTFEKNGKLYRMARYYAPSRGPRPESYSEDYKLGEFYATQEEKENLYMRMKSGAETGWDFSSRWFITKNESDRGKLSDSQTPNIIPVDLNSILQENARILSTWFYQMGNQMKAEKYAAIAQQFLNNIEEVMWREDKGVWFDWDLINHKHREWFFVSNIVPLWTGSYRTSKDTVANAVIEYLINRNIIEPDHSVRLNGTPTSLCNSTQQWDFPNAWPPLQAFIIQGLDRTGNQIAQKVAMKLASIWLHTNHKGFLANSAMFEKYDASIIGVSGKGGEYEPQSGFGWTNGVVLELLNRYGYLVYYSPYSPPNGPQNYAGIRPTKKSAKRYTFWD